MKTGLKELKNIVAWQKETLKRAENPLPTPTGEVYYMPNRTPKEPVKAKSRKDYFKAYRLRMKNNAEYLTAKRERENKGRVRKFYYYATDKQATKLVKIKTKKELLKLQEEKGYLIFLCKIVRSGKKLKDSSREQWEYV